jgi:long-subunit fatty acid transport protein
MSPIGGIFRSFSDAPGGLREELQEIYWGVGVEYAYNNQFFLRGGYHYENEYKGNRKYFTLGTGFKMSTFALDAAYLISTAQSNPLDQTLRFTLSFDMDGIREIMGR